MSNVFQSILKGSVVIVASRVVLKAFAFVSYLLTLRVLSVGEYGVVALALSLSGPMLALSGFGLDDLLLSQGARARGESTFSTFAETYAGFAFVKVGMTLVTILLGAGMVWLAPHLLSPERLATVSRFFWPLIVWVAVSSLRVLTDAMLQMFERFTRFANVMVLETFLRTLMIIALYLGKGITPTSVIWTYVLSKSVGTICSLPILKKLNAPTWGAVRAFLAFVKVQGKWEVIRNFTGTLFSAVDQWVVGLFLGVEAVGTLAFASQMNSLLSSALPFRQVLFPVLSRLSSQPKSSEFVSRRMAKYGVWFYSCVILASVVVAPFLLRWFVPHFEPAYPVFVLLSLAQIMSSLTTAHGTLFYALREQKFLLGVSSLGTVSALTLLPLLTWWLGVYGAVIERHISSLVIMVLRERRLRSKYGIATFRVHDLWTLDAFDRQVVHRSWETIRAKLPGQRAPA